MLFADYKEQAKRTNPNLYTAHRHWSVRWFFQLLLLIPSIRKEAEVRNALHMLAGMVSENYELEEAVSKEDKTNIGEEITDKLWYAANLINIWKIDISIIPNSYQSVTGDAELDIIHIESELMDYVKKEFAYRKKYDIDNMILRKNLLINYLGALGLLYKQFGLDCYQQMQNNIDKLRARFPKKFDTIKATNRNLEAERKELEK